LKITFEKIFVKFMPEYEKHATNGNDKNIQIVDKRGINYEYLSDLHGRVMS